MSTPNQQENSSTMKKLKSKVSCMFSKSKSKSIEDLHAAFTVDPDAPPIPPLPPMPPVPAHLCKNSDLPPIPIFTHNNSSAHTMTPDRFSSASKGKATARSSAATFSWTSSRPSAPILLGTTFAGTNLVDLAVLNQPLRRSRDPVTLRPNRPASSETPTADEMQQLATPVGVRNVSAPLEFTEGTLIERATAHVITVVEGRELYSDSPNRVTWGHEDGKPGMFFRDPEGFFKFIPSI
ncbi:hypothetical protein BCR34DRAFT_597893 [Clohesyomyces aquaticus]|uniref:Uncharacterized protein n=1 Tax=Clohesyomyces aquaticus TaxID=1231657 RepID=A0A1Y2A0Q4_9PLEO|nr:hypothetical protein BCR34DRAFT_597893 [Clohesyomyces aquaticus]